MIKTNRSDSSTKLVLLTEKELIKALNSHSFSVANVEILIVKWIKIWDQKVVFKNAYQEKQLCEYISTCSL